MYIYMCCECFLNPIPFRSKMKMITCKSCHQTCYTIDTKDPRASIDSSQVDRLDISGDVCCALICTWRHMCGVSVTTRWIMHV